MRDYGIGKAVKFESMVLRLVQHTNVVDKFPPCSYVNDTLTQ